MFVPATEVGQHRGRPKTPRARYEKAIIICAVCPVREECLETALAEGWINGVWGGMTPDDRKIILQQRQR